MSCIALRKEIWYHMPIWRDGVVWLVVAEVPPMRSYVRESVPNATLVGKM